MTANSAIGKGFVSVSHVPLCLFVCLKGYKKLIHEIAIFSKRPTRDFRSSRASRIDKPPIRLVLRKALLEYHSSPGKFETAGYMDPRDLAGDSGSGERGAIHQFMEIERRVARCRWVLGWRGG